MRLLCYIYVYFCVLIRNFSEYIIFKNCGDDGLECIVMKIYIDLSFTSPVPLVIIMDLKEHVTGLMCTSNRKSSVLGKVKYLKNDFDGFVCTTLQLLIKADWGNIFRTKTQSNRLVGRLFHPFLQKLTYPCIILIPILFSSEFLQNPENYIGVPVPLHFSMRNPKIHYYTFSPCIDTRD